MNLATPQISSLTELSIINDSPAKTCETISELPKQRKMLKLKPLITHSLDTNNSHLCNKQFVPEDASQTEKAFHRFLDSLEVDELNLDEFLREKAMQNICTFEWKFSGAEYGNTKLSLFKDIK